MQISSPATSRLAWYDRNSTTIAKSSVLNSIGPHSTTTRWTYTVPSGKHFILEELAYTYAVTTAATTPKLGQIDFGLTPSGGSRQSLMFNYNYPASVNATGEKELIGQILLQSGDVLDVQTADNSTGGELDYNLRGVGVEYDA